ncbi:interferon lambda receptor 1 [Salminus brasiliensis]|uniref:interferon lambda receptor 1 n=1 Tax=Salminus brasiliensis TaxID=930266 RepID=UPI003B83274D
MWPLRALSLLLCCSGLWCHDCNETKLYFVSQNFYSVLHWDEVDIPGQEVQYSVQYKQYGESMWSQITGCQNISATFCDLSPLMITNIYEIHLAKVMVNSMCLGEYVDFVPLEQTVFGAPEVSISLAESSFTVTITTPMAPQNRTITEISQDRSGEPHLKYEVRLTHPASRAGQGTQNRSGVITLSSLEVNTEYCGTAFYLWTHPSKRRQSEGTTFCVTLPGKPWTHIFILPGLLAVLLLITLALVLCQQYVMRKQRLPDMLKQTIPRSDTPPYYSDLKVKIDVVRINSESPWKFDKPVPDVLPVVKGSKAVRNGSSYASQDCEGFPWECNSYANQHVALVENCDPSNESATSYSMVVTSSVPEDPEESPESANSSGVGDSIGSDLFEPRSLHSAGRSGPFQGLTPGQELHEKDSGLMNEAVVLPVLRREGGNLEFSSELLGAPTLLPNSSEIQHLVAGLPPAGERTPLLADLVTVDETEWTDSGFASDYGRVDLTNYVQQNFAEEPCADAIPLVSLPDCASSYRQNWVPGIPLETHLSGSDYVANTEHLTEPDDEEEDEDQDPLSRLGAILLDGWVVQIQR